MTSANASRVEIVGAYCLRTKSVVGGSRISEAGSFRKGKDPIACLRDVVREIGIDSMASKDTDKDKRVTVTLREKISRSGRFVARVLIEGEIDSKSAAAGRRRMCFLGVAASSSTEATTFSVLQRLRASNTWGESKLSRRVFKTAVSEAIRASAGEQDTSSVDADSLSVRHVDERAWGDRLICFVAEDANDVKVCGEIVRTATEDLLDLLRMPFGRFLSHMLYLRMLPRFLDACLRCAARNADDDDDVEDKHGALPTFRRYVFLIFYRVLAASDDAAMLSTIEMGDDPGNYVRMLHDRGVVDATKLIDLCTLYGTSRPSALLLRSVIESSLRLDPRLSKILISVREDVCEILSSVEARMIKYRDKRSSRARAERIDTARYVLDILLSTYSLLDTVPTIVRDFVAKEAKDDARFASRLRRAFEVTLPLVQRDMTNDGDDENVRETMREIVAQSYLAALAIVKCLMDTASSKHCIDDLAFLSMRALLVSLCDESIDDAAKGDILGDSRRPKRLCEAYDDIYGWGGHVAKAESSGAIDSEQVTYLRTLLRSATIDPSTSSRLEVFSDSEEVVDRNDENATWSCAACTFDNEGQHLACAVCGTPRPSSPARSSTRDCTTIVAERQEKLDRALLSNKERKDGVRVSSAWMGKKRVSSSNSCRSSSTKRTIEDAEDEDASTLKARIMSIYNVYEDDAYDAIEATGVCVDRGQMHAPVERNSNHSESRTVAEAFLRSAETKEQERLVAAAPGKIVELQRVLNALPRDGLETTSLRRDDLQSQIEDWKRLLTGDGGLDKSAARQENRRASGGDERAKTSERSAVKGRGDDGRSSANREKSRRRRKGRQKASKANHNRKRNARRKATRSGG